VKPQELVDAMGFQSDEVYQYVDRDTGEIQLVEGILLRAAEAGDETPSLPEWQKPQWLAAQKAVSSDRAIHGNGAFRMFKDAVRRLDLRDDWDEFEEEALREIAI